MYVSFYITNFLNYYLDKMVSNIHKKYNRIDFNASHDGFQTKKCKLFMLNRICEFFASISKMLSYILLKYVISCFYTRVKLLK